MTDSLAAALLDAIDRRTARIAVLGLGYAGLPLAGQFVEGGFAVLGLDTDRRRVERLGRGPASASELAKPLPMSLSAVVQHLRVLEAAGLVRTEKRGRTRTCRLEPAALRTVEHWIAERRAGWERKLDCLGVYLDQQGEES